jgi:hypothetical protein
MSKRNEGRIWRELKQHLMEKISVAASESNNYNTKFYEVTEDTMTPASSHLAFASMVCSEFYDVWVLMDNAYDYLLELERRIDIKSAQLQKIILQLAERSNVSIRTLTTELSDVRSKVENPMLSRIGTFLTEFKEAEAKKKKETKEKEKELKDQYVG